MKVLVLIAGVLDPKWPIAISGGALPERSPDRLILSPFDEAALEMALTLRDADPCTSISAIVAGGAEASKVARAVAAFNVQVATIRISNWWDQNLVATALSSVATDADLILIGREFGDCDDGVVPSLLAARLNRPLFARAQAARGGAVMRETSSAEERLTLEGRLLVSVTNDRRTRLRKPLMKNVMQARQARINELPAYDAESSAELVAVRVLAGCRSPTDCHFILGSPDEQAERLAEMLA
jgi:electron transfer flavoprotein beta subunit